MLVDAPTSIGVEIARVSKKAILLVEFVGFVSGIANACGSFCQFSGPIV